ncbi:hypothetical protein L596_010330 [Steinernema carpocapsae]|uniref:Uncharacterized protein n=1 Tax=Steinernema carpocapsae TaxID=34508 RepID=A0A4V6A6Z0_STECR|nr:hypothetical protein L596_010330 [Steinernema carpocapsae]
MQEFLVCCLSSSFSHKIRSKNSFPSRALIQLLQTGRIIQLVSYRLRVHRTLLHNTQCKNSVRTYYTTRRFRKRFKRPAVMGFGDRLRRATCAKAASRLHKVRDNLISHRSLTSRIV